MNRRKLIGILCVLLLCFGMFAACSKDDKKASDQTDNPVETEEKEEEEDYDNGVVYEEEDENAELSFASSPEDKYIGSWKAKSGKALYLYGNIDITIKEDKTWTGNIADEPLTGSWKVSGKSIELRSELFNGALSFTEKGTLILREDRDGEGEFINTVMSKK